MVYPVQIWVKLWQENPNKLDEPWKSYVSQSRTGNDLATKKV